MPWAISGLQLQARASSSALGLGPQLVGAEKRTIPDLAELQEAPKRAAAICAQIVDQIGWNTFNKHLVCLPVRSACRSLVCHPACSSTRVWGTVHSG